MIGILAVAKCRSKKSADHETSRTKSRTCCAEQNGASTSLLLFCLLPLCATQMRTRSPIP
jgi:hypothetical protein